MINRAVIGVVCNPGEERWVREFFELFKTPWEFYRSRTTYSVIISTDASLKAARASLLVLYSPEPGGDNAEASTKRETSYLVYRAVSFPIYGKLLTFDYAASLVS